MSSHLIASERNSPHSAAAQMLYSMKTATVRAGQGS
jgi:hypothetical protein